MKNPHPLRIMRFGWKAGTLALAGLLVAAANAPAQVWTNINSGNASGVWSATANWSPNTVPNAVDAIADFSTLAITVNSFITNDAPVTVGNLVFSTPTANNTTWTVDGPGGNLITLDKSSGVPTIGVTNTQVLLGGLAGTQGFEKTGNGALAIHGATYGNAVSGTIYVKEGMLATVNGQAFSGFTGDIVVADGASFSANSGFDSIPVPASNIYISGNGTSASGYVNNPATPDGTYNGTQLPTGALDIYGNGVINGTVTLASDARITHAWNNAIIAGPITVTNAGQNLELAITVGGQGALVINNTITLGTGALKITGAPGSGPVALGTAPNTYAGGTIINGGRLVLALGFPDSMDTTGGLTFTAGGELDLNGNSLQLPFISGVNGTITDRELTAGATVVTNNQSMATTFTGAFQDGTARTLSVVKDGTGSWTLGGLSTHTGPTTVNAGALLGRSGGGVANSVVQMANGTTNGYVATAPGGQWSCGGLIYDAGTTYLKYDFGSQLVDNSYPSTFVVNGNVAINGTLNLSVTGGIWLTTGTYTLLSYTGSLTPAPTINLTGLPAGVTATVLNDTANKRIALVVTVIPPPVFPGSFDGVWTSLSYNNSDPTNRLWSLTNNWLGGVVASGSSATADFTTLGIFTNSIASNTAPGTIGKLLFARPTATNNLSWTFNGGAANHLTLASLTPAPPVIMVSNITALVGGIDGGQGFVKEGNGVLAIYGNTYANNVAGPIVVKAGLLASANGAAFANIGSGVSGSFTVEAGASLGINSRFDDVPVTAPIYLYGTGGTPSGYYNNAPITDVVAGADVFGGSTAPFGALDVYGNGRVNGPIYLMTDSKITHSWDNGFIAGAITGTNKNLELRTYQGGQGDLQLNGVITLGTGAITVYGVAGNQGVRLNNANSYTGGTVVNSGKLRVGNVNAVNGGALTLNGGYLDMFDSPGLLVSSLTGGSGSGITDRGTTVGTSTLTVDQSVATTYSGSISNGHLARIVALTKAGTGELALAGINRYSGATTVSAGRLIGVTGGSSSNSVHTIADGATNGVKLATAESRWVCAGLTYASGGSQSLAADFGFITPSTTTAPLLVNGAVAFDGTVTVRISGQFAGTGSYPLVKATGGITGAPAGVVLPPAMTGNVQVIGDTVWLNVLTNTNTPPAQPTILPVYNDGLGNIVIRTVTELNHNYLLQSATNLNAPIVWVTLSSTLGTGGTITSTVPVSTTPPNRFFRYQAQ